MNLKRILKKTIFSLILINSFLFPVISESGIEKLTDDEILKILRDKYIEKNKSDFYIVGPGDQVKVVIADDYPELTTNIFIDGEGFLQLPKIERAYVSGLTLEELNLLINELYKDIVKYTDARTSVNTYRPVKIYVEGEVNNPGMHSLKGSLTSTELFDKTQIFQSMDMPQYGVSQIENAMQSQNFNNNPKVSYYYPSLYDALRKSGGITEFSDLENVSIVRINPISQGGGKIKTVLNIDQFLNEGINDFNNFRIYDGDIIKVPKLKEVDRAVLNKAIRSNLNPKFIKVFVSGRVKQPGMKVLGKPSTLNDAIDLSGGPRVIRGPVNYLTYNNDGTIEKRKIRYSKRNKVGSFKNPYLSEGDLIIVGDSFLSNSTEFLREITAPFQGLYSAYSLIDVLSN